MQASFIAFSALFSVHVGFSGLLGYWIYQSKQQQSLRSQSGPIFLFGLLLIAANWTAPLPLIGKVIMGATSAISIWVSAFRYERIKFNRDWMWFYTAISMALILLWSILQGQELLAFSMSILAFGACVLALQKGRESFG